MGTHEFSPLRREQVAISGNREWLRREWKQHDDQSFIFGGRSGDGASFLGALLSVDNNAEAAEAQPMLGLEQEGTAMNRGRAHKRPPAPQNSRAPGPPAMMFELGFSTISSRSATATAGIRSCKHTVLASSRELRVNRSPAPARGATSP